VRGIVPDRTAADHLSTVIGGAGHNRRQHDNRFERVLEMAGLADNQDSSGHGRTPRSRASFHARSARHLPATPVSIGIDGRPPLADPFLGDVAVTVRSAPDPKVLPRKFGLQASYRWLVSDGLTSTEAAGLIGYVAGLPRQLSPWTIDQITRLLFLRALYHEGEWGEAERKASERPTIEGWAS
jgi:hypothetical protein